MGDFSKTAKIDGMSFHCWGNGMRMKKGKEVKNHDIYGNSMDTA